MYIVKVLVTILNRAHLNSYVSRFGNKVRDRAASKLEKRAQRSALNLSEYINVFRYLKRSAHRATSPVE